MSDNNKIDYYLLSLERVLSGTSLTRRSEVILDVKNKIDTLLSDGATVEEILQNLGSVDRLAAAYGIEYKPQTSQIVKITKWVMLISVVLFLAVAGGLWWLFHNFFETQSNFEFHMDEDQFTIGGNTEPHFSDEESVFEESKDFQALGLKKLEFKFSNGKVRYSTSTDGQVSWRCKTTGLDGQGRTTVNGDVVTVNLIESMVTKCDVKVPEGMSLESKAGNGEVKIVEPAFNIDLKLGNGKVVIQPSPQKEYIYDLEIVNGRVGEFVSSQKPDALSLRVRMTNGTIDRENE